MCVLSVEIGFSEIFVGIENLRNICKIGGVCIFSILHCGFVYRFCV